MSENTIAMLEAEIADAKEEYDRIQALVDPIKVEREIFNEQANVANGQANALTMQIEAIYEANNFKAVARKLGILANTRMDLRQALAAAKGA